MQLAVAVAVAGCHGKTEPVTGTDVDPLTRMAVFVVTTIAGNSIRGNRNSDTANEMFVSGAAVFVPYLLYGFPFK